MINNDINKDLDATVTKRFNIQIHADHFQNSDPSTPIAKEKEHRLSVCNDSLTTIDPSSLVQDERSSLDEETPKKKFLNVKSKILLQDDVPKSPLNTLNVITDPDVKVHEKSEWLNEDKCYVCERVLEKLKMVNPHHCRVCCHAVCGDCSRGRINEYRACDACMKKNREKFHEQSRNDKISEKDFEITALKSDLELKMEEFKEAFRMKKEYAIETNKLENEHQRQRVDHENQRQTAAEELKAAKEQTNLLAKNIEDDKQTIRSKESLLSKIKLQAKALKIEIGQKMAILEEKKQEFETLVCKKTSLTQKAKALNKDFNFDQSRNRNFSLTTNGNPGRYSISGQPVKI